MHPSSERNLYLMPAHIDDLKVFAHLINDEANHPEGLPSFTSLKTRSNEKHGPKFRKKQHNLDALRFTEHTSSVIARNICLRSSALTLLGTASKLAHCSFPSFETCKGFYTH